MAARGPDSPAATFATASVKALVALVPNSAKIPCWSTTGRPRNVRRAASRFGTRWTGSCQFVLNVFQHSSPDPFEHVFYWNFRQRTLKRRSLCQKMLVPQTIHGAAPIDDDLPRWMAALASSAGSRTTCRSPFHDASRRCDHKLYQ